MTRVLSTRLDEKALDELERARRRLGITKKRFLEEAIHERAAQALADEEGDVWAETRGAWRRSEPADTTVRRSRRAFQRGLDRHQGSGRAGLR